MRIYRHLLLVAILAGVFFTASGFMDFANESLELYARGGAVSPSADAIVVLTGGKNRVQEGLLLLRSGRARFLILSGASGSAGLDAIFPRQLTPGERGKIVLERHSTSTYENAVEVGKLIKEGGLKSIILVTSVYHMKRAAFIFRRVLPSGVSILPHAVHSQNFDENRWWASKSIGKLFVEFVKLQWYGARFMMEGKG